MPEKKQNEEQTEAPSTTSGSELIRDVDPNSPEHKDAGQLERERREQEREQDQSA